MTEEPPLGQLFLYGRAVAGILEILEPFSEHEQDRLLATVQANLEEQRRAK